MSNNGKINYLYIHFLSVFFPFTSNSNVNHFNERGERLNRESTFNLEFLS